MQPKAKAKSSPEAYKNSLKKRRLILLGSTIGSFSPLALRNSLNKAFRDKGVLELVVNTITKSLNSGNNLVITTMPSFLAKFLLEKESL